MCSSARSSSSRRWEGQGKRRRSIPMSAAVIPMNATSRLGLSPLGSYHSLMYGRSLYFDTNRAERELSWSPRYGLASCGRGLRPWGCGDFDDCEARDRIRVTHVIPRSPFRCAVCGVGEQNTRL